jgi:hypothetical protein
MSDTTRTKKGISIVLDKKSESLCNCVREPHFKNRNGEIRVFLLLDAQI